MHALHSHCSMKGHSQCRSPLYPLNQASCLTGKGIAAEQRACFACIGSLQPWGASRGLLTFPPSDFKFLVLSECLVVWRWDVRLALHAAHLAQHVLERLQAEKFLVLHSIPQIDVPVHHIDIAHTCLEYLHNYVHPCSIAQRRTMQMEPTCDGVITSALVPLPFH